MNPKWRVVVTNYFANAHYLWLLVIIPIYGYWELFRKEKSSIYFSDIELLSKSQTKVVNWPSYLLFALKVTALFFLILALARPQIKTEQKEIYKKGIDIMIALDASGSMAAEDLDDNRLRSSQTIIQDFIRKRPNDRMGLVVFGTYAITKTPLTFDHNMLINVTELVSLEEAGEGTAIGEAITTALNRLRDSQAKSKIIILLTDGENNSGKIEPIDAAKLAKDMGVKIYTIGIGNPAGAPIPFIHPRLGKQYYRNPDGSIYLSKMNTQTLVKIADITNGSFYRAPNSIELKAIFAEINKLEKVKLKTDIHFMYHEQFDIYIVLALIIIVIEFILSKTILRVGPCI